MDWESRDKRPAPHLEAVRAELRQLLPIQPEVTRRQLDRRYRLALAAIDRVLHTASALYQIGGMVHPDTILREICGAMKLELPRDPDPAPFCDECHRLADNCECPDE